MKGKFVLTTVFIFFVSLTYGQKEKVILSDLSFTSIFGISKTDSLHIYCLLGTGFFRAPFSENSDSLIDDWIEKHPDAKIIPVSSFGPLSENEGEKKSSMTYCWLIDKGDTLNNYLVRNGCYPGGTMMRPQTKGDMSREDKKFYRENKLTFPKIHIHIGKKEYETFMEQIIYAEEFAQENKLGIWNKSNEE